MQQQGNQEPLAQITLPFSMWQQTLQLLEQVAAPLAVTYPIVANMQKQLSEAAEQLKKPIAPPAVQVPVAVEAIEVREEVGDAVAS